MGGSAERIEQGSGLVGLGSGQQGLGGFA